MSTLARLALARQGLASRLQTASLDEQREQARLQALQSIGMQGLGAVQQGIGAVGSHFAQKEALAQRAAEAEKDRNLQRELLKMRLGAQAAQAQAAAQAEANKPLSPAEQRQRLENAIGRVSTAGGMAQRTEDIIFNRAMAGEGGGTGDVGAREAAARAAIADIPGTESLGQQEVFSVLDKSQAVRAAAARPRLVEKDKEAAKYLATSTDLLHNLDEMRRGMEGISDEQWQKMANNESVLREVLSNLDQSAAMSISASLGTGALSANLSGQLAVSVGTENIQAVKEAEKALERAGLDAHTRSVIIMAKVTDRAYGTSQENRYSDADARWYEGHGLANALLLGKADAESRFNSWAGRAYGGLDRRMMDWGQVYDLPPSAVAARERFKGISVDLGGDAGPLLGQEEVAAGHEAIKETMMPSSKVERIGEDFMDMAKSKMQSADEAVGVESPNPKKVADDATLDVLTGPWSGARRALKSLGMSDDEIVKLGLPVLRLFDDEKIKALVGEGGEKTEPKPDAPPEPGDLSAVDSRFDPAKELLGRKDKMAARQAEASAAGMSDAERRVRDRAELAERLGRSPGGTTMDAAKNALRAARLGPIGPALDEMGSLLGLGEKEKPPAVEPIVGSMALRHGTGTEASAPAPSGSNQELAMAISKHLVAHQNMPAESRQYLESLARRAYKGDLDREETLRAWELVDPDVWDLSARTGEPLRIIRHK